MPSCRKCGAYTKFYNGLCSVCYSDKNSKAGKVYFGEVTFRNGEKVIYTGQTRRSVYQRVSEHKDNQYEHNTKTYTGRGIRFKLLGSIFSNNRFKAEKTCKELSPSEKFSLAKEGARKFKRAYY